MSDTPITDRAHQDSKIKNQGIPDKEWPWAAINAGWDFARRLELQRNGLIVKLEVLAKELKQMGEVNNSFELEWDGFLSAVDILEKIIQEAKQ